MAIISESENKVFRGYTNSQFRYAFIYILITLVVLSILNVYCALSSQNLFYQSKESAMIEKCYLAADEIAKLDVLNTSTVTATISQMESLTVSRLLVTDQHGLVIYDSLGNSVGQYARCSVGGRRLKNSIPLSPYLASGKYFRKGGKHNDSEG